MLGSAISLRRAFDPYTEPGQIGVIGYVMGGIDGPGGTLDIGHALLDAGVCVLEVGIPFSDPTADGPTIRRQAERALSQGATVAGCLAQAGELAQAAIAPVVTMGYINSVFNFGAEAYAQTLKSEGISGTIIADAPVDEPLGIRAALSAAERAFIPLATPTSSDARLAQLCDAAGSGGFIYCVARRGVTGSRVQDGGSQDAASALAATVELVQRVRSAQAQVPRAVGFGISSPDDVRNLSEHAEAVVVASAMFDLIETQPSSKRATAAHDYMASLVAAGSG